jgi:hypothetical protein
VEFADAEKRRQWREEKQMIVFQMYNPRPDSTRLDLFVTEPFDFEREYAAALWETVAGVPSPVLQMETLMEMKKQAGRPKDLGDLGELEKLLQIRNDESSSR